MRTPERAKKKMANDKRNEKARAKATIAAADSEGAQDITALVIAVATTTVEISSAKELRAAKEVEEISTAKTADAPETISSGTGISAPTPLAEDASARAAKARRLARRSVTPEQLAAMLSHYRDGESFRRVGERFGLSGQQVRDLFIAEKLDYRLAIRRRVFAPELIREMHEFYSGGATMAETADRFAVPVKRLGDLFAEQRLARKARPIAPKRTREQILAMYELYAGGATLAEVGAAHDLSPARVSALFAGALGRDYRSAARGGRRGKWTRERVLELFAEYRNGKSLAEVGADCNLSATHVRQLFVVHELDHAAHKYRQPTAEQVRKMFARYLAGETFAQLEDAWGVSQWTIRRRFIRHRLAYQRRATAPREATGED